MTRTTELEAMVRATVTDLAAESQARDLMPGVRARARRIRTVHRTGYLAAALAAALVVLVPYLVSRPSTRVEPGPPPNPVPNPVPSLWDTAIRLPGGWVVIGSSYVGSGHNPDPHAWVLDRHTQRYQRLGYPVALPAPTGTRVLVEYPDSTAYALLDLASGDVRELEVRPGVTHPEWSPDGSRIVFTGPLYGYLLVDVATGVVTEHPVDERTYRCNDNCEFTWYPDGVRLVLAQTDPTVAHDEALPDVQRGLQLFDAGTGQPGPLLPVRGIVHAVRDWSPDGRWVAVEGTTGTGPDRAVRAQLVDAVTGQVKAVLPTPPWGTQGWVDPQRLLVRSGAGLCLVDLTGVVSGCAAAPQPPEDGEDVLIGPA